jgi:hypothetical protein
VVPPGAGDPAELHALLSGYGGYGGYGGRGRQSGRGWGIDGADTGTGAVGAVGGETVLHPYEDPTVRLPEPDAIVIGRASNVSTTPTDTLDFT